TPGTITYTPNLIVMPDLVYESYPFNLSIVNKSFSPMRPARLTRLYADNILFWDVTEVNGTGPSFGAQYVVGYEVDGRSFLPTQCPERSLTEIFPHQIASRDEAAAGIVLSQVQKKSNHEEHEGAKKRIRIFFFVSVLRAPSRRRGAFCFWLRLLGVCLVGNRV